MAEALGLTMHADDGVIVPFESALRDLSACDRDRVQSLLSGDSEFEEISVGSDDAGTPRGFSTKETARKWWACGC